MNLDTLTPEDRLAYRMQKYRPVVEFLIHHMHHDAEKLKTVMESDETWFNDTACALTLDEMLVLYEKGEAMQKFLEKETWNDGYAVGFTEVKRANYD